MKLFQQMLVAPAALGLMAPIAVNAADLNLNGVSEYTSPTVEVKNFSDVQPTDWAFKALSNLANREGCADLMPSGSITRHEAAALLKKCVANVSELDSEGRRLLDEFAPELASIKDGTDSKLGIEAGQFSSTSTLSGTAVFSYASVSNGGALDNQEEIYNQYAYVLELNTSFTGEDLLYAELEAGNANGPMAFMDSAVDTGDVIDVASLFYVFPVGEKWEVTFGPLVDQDDVIAATYSVYNDSYRHLSMPFSAAGFETGPGVGLSYENENGFVASASFVSQDGTDPSRGILADNGSDVVTLSAGYNADTWGGGLILASNDSEGTYWGYDTLGAGLYWTPEEWPATFTVTFDVNDPEYDSSDYRDLFFGVTYDVGPGSIGAAYYTMDVEDNEDADAAGYEVTYTYDLNDNISITPGLWYQEDIGAGDDETAIFVETVFSF